MSSDALRKRIHEGKNQRRQNARLTMSYQKALMLVGEFILLESGVVSTIFAGETVSLPLDGFGRRGGGVASLPLSTGMPLLLGTQGGLIFKRRRRKMAEDGRLSVGKIAGQAR